MALITHRPIDQLGADWQVLARSPRAREAMVALSAAEPEIARLELSDLGALVLRLRRAGSPTERERSAALFRALLRSQGVHPLLARASLQALVPGLVGVARRLGWGRGGEWNDGGAFLADLIASAWEVVVSWSGEDRPYAALDVLSAVRCRMRRQIVRYRASLDVLTNGQQDDVRFSTPTVCALSDLEVLAATLEDLKDRGLDRADAAVIYGTRVLGLTVTEMAGLSGLTRRQLDGHRRRAERELCA
jgi:hypothetical protein